MRKNLSVALMTVAALGLGANAAFAAEAPKAKPAQASAYEKQKVVYHVNSDDTKQLNATLGNIQNHINAVGKENLDLRVVMHGNGLGLLQQANADPEMQSKVINLKKQGIHFNVCANTLKGKKINYKNDLYDVSEQDIVPSGVAEIAALQAKGYSYVKP